eukprot:858887-Amorphochlora_amoeboformis.AAC.1
MGDSRFVPEIPGNFGRQERRTPPPTASFPSGPLPSEILKCCTLYSVASRVRTFSWLFSAQER